MELQNIITITANELLSETLKLKNEGYRLVAISCSYLKDAAANTAAKKSETTGKTAETAAKPDGIDEPAVTPAADGEGKEYAMVRNKDLELTYSFDNGKDFTNLRIITDTEEEVMSISVIYGYSFLYENEIKELFGVRIKDISIDFNDQLYQIPVKTPFNLKKEGK